jgi:hypothetical protein
VGRVQRWIRFQLAESYGQQSESPKNKLLNSFVCGVTFQRNLSNSNWGCHGRSAGRHMYLGICAKTLTSVKIQGRRSIACTPMKISRY